MDIDVHTLGGQGDKRKLGALAIAFSGAGLGLLFSLYGGLRHPYNRLFSVVASGKVEGQNQADHRQSPVSQAISHSDKDSRNRCEN